MTDKHTQGVWLQVQGQAHGSKNGIHLAQALRKRALRKSVQQEIAKPYFQQRVEQQNHMFYKKYY